MSQSFFSFSARRLSGEDQSLSDFAGSVVLVVNVASQCGFTGQYAGLQQLYRDYGAQGLIVLGFPCDQFGHQEPGEEHEIAQFCQTRFEVTFPMFAKIEVNGAGAHPLYHFLKQQAKGLLGSESIKWNFTKFLINRQGEVVSRHAPIETPDSLRPQIEALLAGPRS